MQVVESHGHRKRQLAKAIAQIVPNDADLEIKAAVSPQDIGKLKLYQKVQMKISACPYPEYGTLEGGIDRIATDTSKPQNATPAFYEVSVAPAQTEFG